MNPIAIIGGILLTVTFFCSLLARVPLIDKYLGFIPAVASYGYLLYPFSFFLLAYGIFPNIIVAVVVAIIVAFIINFLIPSGLI